jgi:hypothetical protein
MKLSGYCLCGRKGVEDSPRGFGVSTNYLASSGWRITTWRTGLVCAGLVISLQHMAAGHDLYAVYIQHNVSLTVGARYTDLELDLTFFEEWSGRERAAMDADADGRITRSEVETYAKKLAPELARQLKLCAAGQELALVPLYAPEVDLLGNDRVDQAHHRLRLYFFAPTPTLLHAGDEFVVEDRLWAAARTLETVQAEGRDGCTLEAGIADDPGFAPVRAGEARLFKIRCLKPPKAQADRPMASPASANPHPSQHPSD